MTLHSEAQVHYRDFFFWRHQLFGNVHLCPSYPPGLPRTLVSGMEQTSRALTYLPVINGGTRNLHHLRRCHHIWCFSFADHLQRHHLAQPRPNFTWFHGNRQRYRPGARRCQEDRSTLAVGAREAPNTPPRAKPFSLPMHSRCPYNYTIDPHREAYDNFGAVRTRGCHNR